MPVLSLKAPWVWQRKSAHHYPCGTLLAYVSVQRRLSLAHTCRLSGDRVLQSRQTGKQILTRVGSYPLPDQARQGPGEGGGYRGVDPAELQELITQQAGRP